MKNNFNTLSGVYKVKTFGTIQSIGFFEILLNVMPFWQDKAQHKMPQNYISWILKWDLAKRRYISAKPAPETVIRCGGWDSNPRTPTRQGPQPCAFDLAWQPPHTKKLRDI